MLAAQSADAGRSQMQDAEKIAKQAEAEEKYLAQAAAVKSAIDHLKMRKALKAAEMQTQKEQDVIMKVAFFLASSAGTT